VLAATVAFAPPGADAKTPCRNKIYNDWDRDGKIASTYPLSCYRDALRHIPDGDSVYTSLEDDIRAALQAAIARSHGKHVAPQVGHGLEKSDARKVSPPNSNPDPKSKMDEKPEPLASMTTTVSALPGAQPAAGGAGIPTPLLVLGGLALALVLTGGIGYAVRANRGSGPGA
jgi:hypothetical protein